jgi:hypothetical protein
MIPKLPLKLDHAIREVTAQVYRQRILKGRLVFGSVLLVLVLMLGVTVEVLVDTSVPLAGLFVVFAVALLWSGHRWLWLPRRRGAIPRVDVARFLDAHHPELEDLVLSSVSLGGDASASQWMVSQVLSSARALSGAVVSTSVANPKWVRGFRRKLMAVWSTGLAMGAILMLHWGAMGIGDRLFAGAPEPLPAFNVAPGDVRVRVGDHQLVWVTTDQKNASKAIRGRHVGGEWQTTAVEPGQGDGVFAFQLRHLLVDTEYQVQIGQLRSALHRISVWTPPEVVAIDLTYRYPAYLKMADHVVPHGGDIVVPQGTEVQLDVLVNKDLETTMMTLGDGQELLLLRVEDGVWRANMTVTENDTYQILLRDLDGEENAKPRDYKITAKVDDPPDIRIRFPRGDDEATPLEEVSFGFIVKDDYGLVNYGLQYEVAGRDPVRVSLKKGDERVEKAEDEFMLALEDAKVEPGDFITWTVWAEDGKPERDAVELLGDPYFLEIRPFERFYRQSISNGGQQQPQAGGQQETEADQKQVIIATWNLRKKAKQLSADEFVQNQATIIEAQKAVQAQAMNEVNGSARGATLIEDLNRELTGALTALEDAVYTDPDAALARALGHEQRAHRLMLQLKPQESEVAQNRNSRGQGGGQRRGQQRELDGLELAQRRDFREEASTVQQQLAEAAQARNQIEDLTRRQAAINEDMARLISEMESMGETEREEAKRRLEQLQESQQRTMASLDQVNGEMASGDLDPQQARQAREQLEAAREEMNRSARSMENDQLQQARAAGNRALGALRDVQEQLTQLSRQAASERMARLQAGMDSLRAQQQRVVDGAEKQQTQTPEALSLDEGGDAVGNMLAEKRAMADAFKEVMDEASDLAENSGESQELMSQNLGDWLRATSREGIYEEMVEGERFMQEGLWASASEHEKGVQEKLDAAAERLNAVAGDLVRDDLDAMERALQRVRGLANEAEGTPQDAEGMQDFAARGFREWMDEVREAQALLPEGDGAGQQLGRIRDGLAGIGRDYQRAAKVPQYDLVFDEVIKPLKLVAEELDRSVRARRDAYGFAAENADAVPEAYRDHVAEYFKALAEMDGVGK